MQKLSGVGVALVTPFKKDLSVDLDSLTKLVEHNIEGGASFLVILGTTGEYVTLTDEEKNTVINHIAKVNDHRLPMVLGIGGNNTAKVVKQIQETDTSRFEAILSTSPYYNKPNQEGLYQHYKALAKTGKNIIIYNVPGRTGKNVETATILRLAKEFKNIVMVKEAGPNIDQYFDIIRQKPEGFELFSGDDEKALAVALAGSQGVISVIGQAYPKQFSSMIKLGLEGNAKEAYKIQNKFVEIIRLIFEEGNPTGIKYILSKQGIIKNYLRLPLVPASEALERKIDKQMLLLK